MKNSKFLFITLIALSNLLPGTTFSALKAFSGMVSEATSVVEEALYEKYSLTQANRETFEPEVDPSQRGELINYEQSLLKLTGRSRPPLRTSGTGGNSTTESLSIRIEKSAYRLVVVWKGKDLKAYPCVFGFNPTDDKRMQGDGCTPEGMFTLRSVYHHDSWSRFLWVDYPTADSYDKHNASKAAGEIPKTATIGGEIGIHGVPEGDDWAIDSMVNWTLGCISLKNEDVNELYDWCREGTQVEIVK